VTMISGNTQDSIAIRKQIGIQEIKLAREKMEHEAIVQVLNCHGSHRYFVAETFAVEGEGTVGAVIICTSCGESKLITHKVGREGCSVLLKQKGEKQ